MFEPLSLAAGNNSNFNKAEIILNPSYSVGQFVLSSGDYEDIRLDVDLDGQIDFWKIEDKDSSIEISFLKDTIKYIFIRRYLHSGEVVEILYSTSGKNQNLLYLADAKLRATYEMPYSDAEACLEFVKNETKNIANLDDIAAAIAAKNLVAENCKEQLGEEFKKLSGAVFKLVANKDDISMCIDNPDFLTKLERMGKSKVEVELLRASFKLQKQKFLKNPESMKNYFSCEKVDKHKMDPGFFFFENNKIKIVKNQDSQVLNVNEKKVNHEVLHSIGIFSETEVHNFVEACEKTLNKITEIEKSTESSTEDLANSGSLPTLAPTGFASQTEIKGKSTANTASVGDAKVAVNAKTGGAEARSPSSIKEVAQVRESAAMAAIDVSASIPKEVTIAQTQVPSPKSVSNTIYENHQKTPEGLSKAYAKSNLQTGGPLSFANRLTGSFSTPAQATTLAGTGATNSREVASAGLPSLMTGAPGRATGGLISRNKIGADESVVEQFELKNNAGQGSPVQKGNAQNLASNVTETTADTSSGSSGAVDNRTAQLTQVANNGGGGSAAFGGTGSSGGGGGSSALNTGSSPVQINPVSDAPTPKLGKAVTLPQRQPANTGQIEPLNNVNKLSRISREEVITFIAQGDYQNTKQRLKDPTFTRQLEMQNITVLDLYGNSLGARKGEVIFLEKEDRFVRQK